MNTPSVTRLTPEQKRRIVESRLSSRAAARAAGCSASMVSRVRREAKRKGGGK